MEICKETLSDFLERRNQQLSRRNLDNFLKENENEILKTFSQICAAINYIHSKEKLIHRDLKPKNIFYTFEDKIKIGDFGLATNKKYTQINQCKEENKDQNANCKTNEFNYVGTVAYAAPEQIQKNINDFKVNYFFKPKADIYSLGLTLFELAYPMKTLMEKHKKFDEIKKGIIPSYIKEQSPIIHKLLELMICENAKNRPNAKNILAFIKEYQNKINEKKSSPKKQHSRKRFFSEDNDSQKKFELFIKFDEDRSESWKNMYVLLNNFRWIQIFDDKLLIFNQDNTAKANMCYDLKECDIIGKFVDEKNSKKKNKKSSSVSSFNELNNYNNFHIKPLSGEKNELLDQLNFVIDIDHPYLQKCYIKCDNLLESLEFYNEIIKIGSG